MRDAIAGWLFTFGTFLSECLLTRDVLKFTVWGFVRESRASGLRRTASAQSLVRSSHCRVANAWSKAPGCSLFQAKKLLNVRGHRPEQPLSRSQLVGSPYCSPPAVSIRFRAGINFGAAQRQGWAELGEPVVAEFAEINCVEHVTQGVSPVWETSAWFVFTVGMAG